MEAGEATSNLSRKSDTFICPLLRVDILPYTAIYNQKLKGKEKKPKS